MKRMMGLVLLVAMLAVACAQGAALERDAFLDCAFTMLEKDNIFLARYREATGSQTEALFELGVPYFYGGQDVKRLLAKYPEYTVMNQWQNSLYYKEGKVYLYGFDCTGFVKWVYGETGNRINGTVLELAGMAGHDHHLYCNEHGNPMPPDWTAVSAQLRPGDLLIVRHPGTHVMMYIGTLRRYGFSEEEVPALADFLDYPLVIQSGTNPLFGERFSRFLETTDNRKYYGAQTTDGGVCVGIVGVPTDRAQRHETVQKQEQWWFELDEGRTALTLLDFDTVVTYCWYRP